MHRPDFNSCGFKASKIPRPCIRRWGGKWLIISMLCFWGSLCLNIFYEYRTHELEQDIAALGWIKMPPNKYSDYKLIGGWSGSLEKLNIEADAAFIGNSITNGSDFQKYFPYKHIVTLGVSGQRVDEIERRIPTLVAIHPQKIFVMAGINDLHRSSPETVEKRYESLVHEIKKQLPSATIYIQSILPISKEKEKLYKPNSVIDETNMLLKKTAISNGCIYIDLNKLYRSKSGYIQQSMTSDGVHLKPESYDIWANTISEYMD